MVVTITAFIYFSRMERLPLLIIVEMTPGQGMSLLLNHFCIGDYFCAIPYITLYAVEVNRFGCVAVLYFENVDEAAGYAHQNTIRYRNGSHSGKNKQHSKKMNGDSSERGAVEDALVILLCKLGRQNMRYDM
jgi:hypothetical protein